MSRLDGVSPRDAGVDENRHYQPKGHRAQKPSMMAERLRLAATSSSPTAVVASAPKTRPFDVRPPPAHLYSPAESRTSSPSAQVAPSRPPKIYDAPPPTITYRRSSATPEQRSSVDSYTAPAIPPKISIDTQMPPAVETRQPTPPSSTTIFRNPSYDQNLHRASAIHPPAAAPLVEPFEPTPEDEQPPTLPPRPQSQWRPFEVEPAPEPERRGSATSRPFQVRPPINRLELSFEKRESPRPFDVPFRSPILFPPAASDTPSMRETPTPPLKMRKDSAPTFEFEPPLATPEAAKGLSLQETLEREPEWQMFHSVPPPSPPAKIASPVKVSPPAMPPPAPKAAPPSPPLPDFDMIKPPPGPPPAFHKGKKKSVSFATRDSIISAVAHPQSPLSDSGRPSPVLTSAFEESPIQSPRNSSDSSQSHAELPILLRIDEQELASNSALSPQFEHPPPAEASSSRAPPPLEIPPPVGPPLTLVQEPEPVRQDEGIDFDEAVAQLVDYGFSAEEASRGLLENGSGIDVQAAANWLLDEANQPEAPPLPARPAQCNLEEIEPPSPLSPSDDASSDMYEAEPVSPVSLYAPPVPRLNVNAVPADHRFSRVFPDDLEIMPGAVSTPQPPSPPREKQDIAAVETYRPTSSSNSQTPPSPPSSKEKEASLDQTDMPTQPPSYASLDHGSRIPNPLSSHPVQVAPKAAVASPPPAPSSTPSSHRIPRKKVPLVTLDTNFTSASSSSSATTTPARTSEARTGIAAAVMGSLAAAAPAAPDVQPQADFAPLSAQRTSVSLTDSFDSATATPRSSTDTTKPARKRKGSLSKGWGRFKGIANIATNAGFRGETIEKECDKAARILRAFCKHGVYADPSNGGPPEASSSASSSKSEKKLVRIPPEVMQKAVGLAIFTTLRVGLGIGESTGSGVVIARLHDGSWSPPSAISLQSFSAGVAAGVDLFDCVCVINTQEALSAFTDSRFSLGAGVAVAAGPWGTGRSVEWGSMHNRDREGKRSRKSSVTEDDNSLTSPPPTFELNDEPLAIMEPRQKRQGNTVTMSPVYSYVKSKGLFAGFTYEGNVVNERKGANKRFYQDDVTVEQILRGAVRAPEGSESLKSLHEALVAAEGGRRDSIANPTIQEEVPTIEEPEPEPQTNWPMDIKPKFPEDSLHPAEAFGMRYN